MYCPKCGKEVEEGAKYCGYCGAELLKKGGMPVIDTKDKKEEQISAEKVKKVEGDKEVSVGRKIAAGIILAIIAFLLLVFIIGSVVEGGVGMRGVFVMTLMVAALWTLFQYIRGK